MHVLFDNVTAVIVGTVVLILVIALQSDVRDATVERTVMYSTKKQTLSLADMLERDLINAGFGVLPGETGILWHSVDSVGGVVYTDRLEFRSVDPVGNPLEARYLISVAGSTELDGASVPLLQLTREVRSGGAWTPAGGSSPTLTAFSIDLLNDQNTPTDLAGARRLRVRFANAVLSGSHDSDAGRRRNRVLSQFHWAVTVEPPGLRQQSFQG